MSGYGGHHRSQQDVSEDTQVPIPEGRGISTESDAFSWNLGCYLGILKQGKLGQPFVRTRRSMTICRLHYTQQTSRRVNEFMGTRGATVHALGSLGHWHACRHCSDTPGPRHGRGKPANGSGSPLSHFRKLPLHQSFVTAEAANTDGLFCHMCSLSTSRVTFHLHHNQMRETHFPQPLHGWGNWGAEWLVNSQGLSAGQEGAGPKCRWPGYRAWAHGEPLALVRSWAQAGRRGCWVTFGRSRPLWALAYTSTTQQAGSSWVIPDFQVNFVSLPDFKGLDSTLIFNHKRKNIRRESTKNVPNVP